MQGEDWYRYLGSLPPDLNVSGPLPLERQIFDPSQVDYPRYTDQPIQGDQSIPFGPIPGSEELISKTKQQFSQNEPTQGQFAVPGLPANAGFMQAGKYRGYSAGTEVPLGQGILSVGGNYGRVQGAQSPYTEPSYGVKAGYNFRFAEGGMVNGIDALFVAPEVSQMSPQTRFQGIAPYYDRFSNVPLK